MSDITRQPEPPATVAIALAAGQGARMGASQNKVFLPLAGRPLLAYSLADLLAMPDIAELVIVAHPQEAARMAAFVAEQIITAKPIVIVTGGATRHQSEYCALAALRPRIEAGAIGAILIHDGARPFIERDEVARLLSVARDHGAALLATPVSPHERIIQVDATGEITQAVSSAALWRAQTPQAFQARRLLAAYDLADVAGFTGTDTAAAFDRLGWPVYVVPCAPTNIKVTTPEDLIRAEAILRERSGAAGPHEA
jgi:2-C-methyl-D-erythritol 4-phosphate cytidylyltransferase